ncbi:unnamed protein product [Lactuca saligna]|uniref:Uncharacterized protein n=1 Tax=Lactuca saligna TaxID=75948 RepID=A0AA35Z6R8_LACSI|nr:unnamed protein product [Lactuca saligna]
MAVLIPISENHPVSNTMMVVALTSISIFNLRSPLAVQWRNEREKITVRRVMTYGVRWSFGPAEDGGGVWCYIIRLDNIQEEKIGVGSIVCRCSSLLGVLVLPEVRDFPTEMVVAYGCSPER